MKRICKRQIEEICEIKGMENGRRENIF